MIIEFPWIQRVFHRSKTAHLKERSRNDPIQDAAAMYGHQIATAEAGTTGSKAASIDQDRSGRRHGGRIRNPGSAALICLNNTLTRSTLPHPAGPAAIAPPPSKSS
jgi:hypothetical protein